ncbi:MAG: S41 family peptidase, partial [Bacteroidota bacterium]
YLSAKIEELSSYAGLNGFDYAVEFEKLLQSPNTDVTSVAGFGRFLTKVIGQLGDRHAWVGNYRIESAGLLPFTVAPYREKVVALVFDENTDTYQLLYTDYPYLTAINGWPILDYLAEVAAEEVCAPTAAFLNRGTQYLAHVDFIPSKDGVFPTTFSFTFSNDHGKDTLLTTPYPFQDQSPVWQEKFSRMRYRKSEFNQAEIYEPLFSLDDQQIAYIRIPRMVDSDDAPNFIGKVASFMAESKDSKALIIDIRDNGGGDRELVWDIAGYIVHPDSLHVVNVARQRAVPPLNPDQAEDLNNRNLFAFNQLDAQEQKAVTRFNEGFRPIYNLSDDRFGPPYYAVFNGQKLSKGKYHYPKPVYLLVNERVFSAASVFAATFKNLPNVTVAGVTTDGSSGNSEDFYLPHSDLRVNLSTMVSFQKNGKILDGFGTDPDLEIPRSLDQVLWKEDYQLEKLKEMINEGK